MYRVKINGAHCIRETVDDALERDGKGDEIFFTWSAAIKSSLSMATHTGMSLVYGDTNNQPGRRKAGDRSDMGGIRTGNIIPFRVVPTKLHGSPPWLPAFPLPAPYADSPAIDEFPIIIWQGELRSNDLVVICPLVWEYDGGGFDPQPTLDVANKLVQVVGAIVGAVQPQAAAAAAAISKAVGEAIASLGNLLGVAGNRPVGVDVKHIDNAKNVVWPSITLDKAGVDTLIAQNPTGHGKGIYRYVQTDPASIGGGEYAFYIQIEEVQS